MTASDLTVIALCVYLVGIIFGCIGIYIHHIIKYKNMVKDYYERGGDDEVGGYAVCTGDVHYDYCIPYNEDTKHLVGKSEDAPVFYRYWEDK